MVDIVVIGAGPVGLTCGIEAVRSGLDAVIVDKGALVNSIVGYPLHMEFFSTPELLEIGGHPFPTLRYKPTRGETIEYYRRVAQREELNLRLYERVLSVDGADGNFSVATTKGRIACRRWWRQSAFLTSRTCSAYRASRSPRSPTTTGSPIRIPDRTLPWSAAGIPPPKPRWSATGMVRR